MPASEQQVGRGEADGTVTSRRDALEGALDVTLNVRVLLVEVA